jgi:hypothetical protein
MKGMFAMRNIMYYLLTAVTFYLVAFVLPLHSLGGLPEVWVRALVFVVVHVALHRVKKLV